MNAKETLLHLCEVADLTKVGLTEKVLVVLQEEAVRAGFILDDESAGCYMLGSSIAMCLLRGQINGMTEVYMIRETGRAFVHAYRNKHKSNPSIGVNNYLAHSVLMDGVVTYNFNVKVTEFVLSKPNFNDAIKSI
jgi:hypothetical protein